MTGAMDPEGVGETPERTVQRLQCSSDSRIYAVVDPRGPTLRAEFDSFPEAQGFLRDMADDALFLEVIAE